MLFEQVEKHFTQFQKAIRVASYFIVDMSLHFTSKRKLAMHTDLLKANALNSLK